MANKKLERNILNIIIVISIINILFYIIAYYIIYFTKILSPRSDFNQLFEFIILIMQVFNIVIIMKIKNEVIKKTKIYIIIMIIILVSTLFIPCIETTKITNHIMPTKQMKEYPKGIVSLEPFDVEYTGSTTFTTQYKNIYMFTIKEYNKTVLGVLDLFDDYR